MKPKGSIFKRGKGSKITWWARVRFIDPEVGKPKDLQRRADSRADAIDKRDALLHDIRETAGRSVGSERMTFAELCTITKNTTQERLNTSKAARLPGCAQSQP